MDKLTWGFGLVAVYGLAGCGGGVPTTVLDRLDSIEARLDAIEANEPGGGTGGGTSGDLEGRVAELEDVVGALDVTVDDLVTGQGVLESDVADLQSQLDGLSSDVATVQGDVSGFESSITTLQGDVSGLQSDIGAVQADVGGVQTDVIALQDGQASVKGVSFSTFGSISASDVTVHDLGSLTVTPPANGQLIVFATGHAVFFGQGRTIDVGIGDSATAIDAATTIGDLDGTGTLRIEQVFSTTTKYTATAGVAQTLHILAQGNAVFDLNSVNISPDELVVVFVPELLP